MKKALNILKILIIVFVFSALIVGMAYTVFYDSTKISHYEVIKNIDKLTIDQYIAKRGLSSSILVTPEEKNQVREFIIESDSELTAASDDVLKINGTRPDNQLFILFTNKER